MAGIGGEGRNFHFKHSKARVGSVLLATLSWLHWRPRIAESWCSYQAQAVQSSQLKVVKEKALSTLALTWSTEGRRDKATRMQRP